MALLRPALPSPGRLPDTDVPWPSRAPAPLLYTLTHSAPPPSAHPRCARRARASHALVQALAVSRVAPETSGSE